jgi:hypothetical protein
MAVDSCNDFTGVFVRPVIYVTNDFGTNQGAERTYSYAQLDKVCFNRTIVAVQDPSRGPDFRIYPNPNTGQFTVHLSEPAERGLSMRIISITGQMVLEKKTVTGNTIQTIEAFDLPQGMYFLQMITDGRLMSVNKFVKQ